MLTSVQDAYEAIYTGRSYQHEMALVDVVLERRLGKWRSEDKEQPPRKVLEVGCGPGLRLSVLHQWHGKYQVEGLDKDPVMLGLAARRVPGVPLHEADMRDFDLERKFDAVLCLFGVIGYMEDTAEMTRTLESIRRHLIPGGVLMLEPWLSPEAVKPGYLQSAFAERAGMEVARMNFTRINGNKSQLSVHYLIGDSNGIRHVQELRQLTLFTDAEYHDALEAAGFGDVALEAYGPQGRGLYVAQG